MLCMAVDGGRENLGIDLSRADILLPKHTGKVLDGDIMCQDPSGESVTGYVRSHFLVQASTAFYEAKIIVQLLIAHARESIVILLQDFHSGFENGGVKGAARFDTTTQYIVKVAVLLGHRLEVECLGIAVGKPGESRENEEVAGFLFLRR